MYINLDRYLVFLLVMLRMSGMFLFNPIFSRQNVPSQVTLGLSFTLTIIITQNLAVAPLPDINFYSFLFLALKEMAVGLLAGFLLQMFMSVLVVGGETIDMNLGLSMAKAFDPSSNTSISITAQIFNIMFIIGFFQSNAHLTLIQMTAKTFELIPIGEITFNNDNFMLMTETFTMIFLLSVKIAMPIIVMEIIVTFAVGMITRVIPQINVFVINVQFKILVGMLVMATLIPIFGNFIDNLMVLFFENLEKVWLNFT